MFPIKDKVDKSVHTYLISFNCAVAGANPTYDVISQPTKTNLVPKKIRLRLRKGCGTAATAAGDLAGVVFQR